MAYFRYKLTRPSVAKLAAESDISGLLWALGSQDDKIYGEAVSALNRIGETAVAPLFRVLTDKRDEWLRRKNAALALGRMTCPVDPTALIAALRDQDRNVQQGAVWAMGNLRVEKAVRPLADLWLDPKCSWYTRTFVVNALGQIGSAEANEALSRMDARLDELLDVLQSGGSADELRALYDFLIRRHVAHGGDQLPFDEMRDQMEYALGQFRDGLRKASRRAGQ